MLEFDINYGRQVDGKDAIYRYVLGGRNLGWVNTTDFGDVCEYLDTSQSIMNTPTTDLNLFIVSTSTDDMPGNAGARSVTFTYLDGDGVEASATYNLNGTTPVDIGTGYSFIQFMEVASVGSNTVSVGNISITSATDAAAVANTFERISANGNRSLSGRYKIPAGYNGYLSDMDAAAVGGTMDVRARATVFAHDRSLSTVYHFQERVFLAAGQNATMSLHYLKCPPLSIVKMSAIPGGAPASNKCDVTFGIVLVEI